MIARAKDLRNMNPEEIEKKLNEVQAEVIRQKGKKTSGGAPESPGRMKELRRTVARIITIQKELGEKSKSKPEVKLKAVGEKESKKEVGGKK